MGTCSKCAQQSFREQWDDLTSLSARRHGLDELVVDFPVVYVVSPSAHPDAPMLALLECAHSLRLGSDVGRQAVAHEQEKASVLDGGLCASAGASSTAEQQQLQASEAGPAQPYGSVSQDCYCTHVGAGGLRRPVPSKAADAEPWLTLQVC